MYLKYFGLKTNPFLLTSELNCIYYSNSHCEAMAHLLYGVRERKGLVLLLGEAGTGKTTMVRATLDLLRSTRVVCSVIFNPIVESAQELLKSVLGGFGITDTPRSPMEMVDFLQSFLELQANRGLIPVLVVDEAQQLSRPPLELIRLLSNLEHNGQKLLQIIFSAQPEMGELLADPRFAALRQRITVRCRLGALSSYEVWRYLAMRVARAGGDGRLIFTPEAAVAVSGFSNGIPRLINNIAGNCLLAAYAKSQPVVDVELVREVANHLELPLIPSSAHLGSTLGKDMLRASGFWNEIVTDLRDSKAPAALLNFVDRIRLPQGSGPMSRSILTSTPKAN
jgi:general secretion pathway protein A